ncbi:DUF3108 domain-containing protein [Roseivirga sp. BDSF3-8]|uniref:DUF3108 domain-containing protein n=1 Tax=Roseivirga sp. BDSF3-8 TaxID=3241598 RepID=UPI00353214CE
MKRRRSAIVLLALALCAFISPGDSAYRSIPNDSFSFGEEIQYRVHYGFITGGEAKLVISNDVFTINDRPCYRVDVFGETTGMVDAMFGVDNNWGSYIDTAAIIPQRSYRYIKEGKYRKNEIVTFDHKKGSALVGSLSKDAKRLKKTETFPVPVNVQDIVSGYYFLRTMDFSRLKEGQGVNIEGFFDEETYKMNLVFMGREELDTKIGTFKAIKLSPRMPENELFDGEDAIEIWLSDDEHKIPLKIKANMFVGAIEIDIKQYREGKGLKRKKR